MRPLAFDKQEFAGLISVLRTFHKREIMLDDREAMALDEALGGVLNFFDRDDIRGTFAQTARGNSR